MTPIPFIMLLCTLAPPHKVEICQVLPHRYQNWYDCEGDRPGGPEGLSQYTVCVPAPAMPPKEPQDENYHPHNSIHARLFSTVDPVGIRSTAPSMPDRHAR